MDPHRLREEQSIAMHARIAEPIRQDPALVKKAKVRVEQWERTGFVHARYIEAWRQKLALPLEDLCRALVDPGERARAMRQVSPFAGALTPDERWRIREAVAEKFGNQR